ncbi:mitochondrial protein [Cryptococcus deuterogattii 99/473]|uniref:Unplaced genomic scaffold supercont1.4, whole genome shotgun sequence n=2 Tax=Cryptococcus deuterogattii TaxID=1859096 RepID=A0A0D0V5D8_9TREE|nr:mitochondrial protein [Cryptococcus deuterogattii R265]KIR27522.1 mitochondrial protein [Cryptococcus deuterogattii LA55]KIR33393.1 mitochondrial protein [Cryptococcus deuterogattii MMRL2647]KIR41864.1 mitochondrial protein [Cryptococcus deuterogattii Ram5]KIR73311.1 mitochondrial protein [Cryptococcus deuterogattii CA1014]KIR91646.1 mitochondrial protein [Cryptococcus deuterogattii CBS 10090]KIR99067.1 mitochondrial protein [Cryptococcus deuterogattii 2001/935-1]KIY60022.1 mitochondrial 
MSFFRPATTSSAALTFSPSICSTSRSIQRCRCLSTTSIALSGHNRWSKIRHRKGAADQQRSALFAKLGKEIVISMRPPASADPAFNSRLATALQRAKEQGLTKQGIENAMARARAVAEGSGQSVIYEAVASGGKVAFMVECVTQNPARLVKRVKELLSKNGARTSPVAFLFEKKGSITLTPNGEGAGYEHLFDLAVEAGAEDVREVEGEDGGVEFEVITTPSDLSSITSTLQSNPAYSLQSSDLVFLPNDPLKVLEEGEEGEGITEETMESVMRLVDTLEEENEVVKVWTNLEE